MESSGLVLKEGTRGVPLPKGVTLTDLKSNYDTMKSEYSRAWQRLKVLDLADTGRIWELIRTRFPEFNITPDTNYVSYIKKNLLASIYSIGKSASVMPMSLADRDIADKLNKVLEHIWTTAQVPMYQMRAGERAALLNLGITQVGWASDVTGGTNEHYYKGDLVFKNIDPLNFGRDPFSDDIESAGWCIFHDRYHISTLMENPEYRKHLKNVESFEDVEVPETYYRETGKTPNSTAKYLNLIIHWVKVFDPTKKEVVIHEIHTISNGFVLQVKEDIKPRMFPFAELYCNVSARDPIGYSEPSLILSSYVVSNLIDGIVASHAYKAQRPPRLISDQAGLNLRMFSKYGNDPDKAFIVNGRAADAVSYITFPTLPQDINNLAGRIAQGIFTTSGIDGRYTGKDTGSVLTTGGIDSMLAQATMRDSPIIAMYENYTRKLTQLTISHLVHYGDKRSYAIKNNGSPGYANIDIDFSMIDEGTMFNYAIDISTLIPKNKAKIDAAADQILEMSMQYGANPPVFTIEEWLRYKDFPQKDLILERLAQDRSNDMTSQVMEILTMFATLVEQGMDPNEAIQYVVEQMQAESQPGGPPTPPAAASMM
jgi:hypothetical protein